MPFGIDALRHVFCIFVIIQHMVSLSRYSADTNLQIMELSGWVDGAVAGFLLISGFFFRPGESLFLYARKQARRLLLPYLTFSFIYSALLIVLGKRSLSGKILVEAAFPGAGPQLYFLPLLYLITLTFSIFTDTVRFRSAIAASLVVCSLVATLLVPTNFSTGPELKLLPFYFLSFATGYLISTFKEKKRKAIFSAAAASTFLLISSFDMRFADLAAVTFLFLAVQTLSRFLPNKRLSGSGGVFLLHTPILNFGLSTLLLVFGVTELYNVVLTIIATYLSSLGLTFICLRRFPGAKRFLLE